jgi:hypothetical protein
MFGYDFPQDLFDQVIQGNVSLVSQLHQFKQQVVV